MQNEPDSKAYHNSWGLCWSDQERPRLDDLPAVMDAVVEMAAGGELTDEAKFYMIKRVMTL